MEYFTRVKDATLKSDKMTKSHKSEFGFMQTPLLGIWAIMNS